MHRLTSQVAVTLVAFLLGLLVVGQLRAQQTAPALAGMSNQDLTVLVANLNAGNEQLRTEVATLERELEALRRDASRGESSVDQLRADLLRIRAFAGLEAVAGPGVRVTIEGPASGQAVGDLVNELWSAGAEAVAVGDVRVVPGTVVAGAPGALSVEGRSLGDAVEVAAIGAQQALTGSLTRLGGVVAQVAATEPLATITVTPVERVVLPATGRSLVPADATPSL